MHVNNAARGGEEKRKNINEKGMLGAFCRRRESGARLLLARGSGDIAGGAGGGIRVTRLRLNGRRQIEEADGDGGTEGGQRGHCSARSPGEDVTSGLKHVAGLRRPCKVSLKVSRVFHPRLPTNPNRRRRNTCRRCGKAMEEEGGGGALPTEGPYRFIYLFCSEKAAGGKQVAPPSR